MTVFGWDSSHFDGQLSPSILARAKSEGIEFFTAKIAEGLADTEGGHDDTALAAARAAGIPLVGGYLIPRSTATVTSQVDYWLKLADAGESWWRTFPGWFWQVDLERWPYDAVPASVGIAAAQQLRARTGRWTILYASRSQYGSQLGGWDGPLWNADYGPTAAYPGDNWAPGWAPYSGQAPTFLQYTSSATIAGLTTCDRNAYRGTLDQLRALVAGTTSPGADVELTDQVAGTATPGFNRNRTVAECLADGDLRTATLVNAVHDLGVDLGAVKQAVSSPPPITLSADQITEIAAALAGLVPTVEELRTIVDAAVKARLDGATVHTAGG